MGDILVYIEPIDDYIVTVASSSTEIAIEVVEEHEVRIEAFEYPAEITVLSAKISEVEEVATEANSAATTALAAATTAQSSADAAMTQAEAATDMAATNSLSISSILANFTAWVLGTYLGALTLLDVAIAAGDSIQAMAGKLQGQLNAVKVRLGLLEKKIIIDYTASVPIASLDITTYADGSPLLLQDGDVVEIETITYSASPLGLLIALNNNKTTGQYQGGSSLASITIVTAPFARCNVMLFVKTDQCIALTNTHRSSGGANTIVASTAMYVTKNTNDGGVIQTPITSINFWGPVLNAGSRICIKKIR